MNDKEKNDILFVKQILTKWQLSEYVSEEVIDKIEGILEYIEKIELDKKELIEKIKKEMRKYERFVNEYDCTKCDYKHSQGIGSWNALHKFLEIVKGENNV